MKNCLKCQKRELFYEGFKGKRYDKERIMIVLNHADNRLKKPEQYLEILLHTWTGKTLKSVLNLNGLDFQDTFITNFVKCVFYNHEEPKHEIYRNCKSLFENQIKKLEPKVIFLFGQKPYEMLFNEDKFEENIKNFGGIESTYDKIPCFISLHPSKIYSKFSLEKRRPYYLAIQNFLIKNNAYKQIIKLPE